MNKNEEILNEAKMTNVKKKKKNKLTNFKKILNGKTR